MFLILMCFRQLNNYFGTLYVEKLLQRISMKLALTLLFLIQISKIACINNLIADSGFQTLGLTLPNSYSSGAEPFQYRVLSNSDSPWYSTVSSGILIRQKTDLNTIVMDTLNLNYGQKICQNFAITSNDPYELSFDYLIDQNIGRSQLTLSMNNKILMSSLISDRIVQRPTFTVYLNNNINILCFQGSNYQSLPIGVLIDNITLAPYDVRYINIIAQPILGQINKIQLISNQTVTNNTQLNIFISQTIINITNVQYNVTNIYNNQNNILIFSIEILQQYASNQAIINITLPSHRNNNGQLIMYFITNNNLCKLLYQPNNMREIVQQSQFIVLLLTKIYNICFRVIKIIGFCFIGMRFLNFFYLFLFLPFLNIQLILPSVRTLLAQIVNLTINSKTISFFLNISGINPLYFGAQFVQIGQTVSNSNSFGLHYKDFDISTNIYSLIIDDLIIAIFNTFKVLLFYYVIFKNKETFLRILKEIKNTKILLQYIPIISIVVLVVGYCCITGIPLTTFFGKINRSICYILPIISIFFCLIIFLGEKQNLRINFTKHLSKYKQISENTTNALNNYDSIIKLNLMQNLMFILIPGFVGYGYVYLALSVFSLSIIIKFRYSIKSLKSKPNFLQFIWAISILLQLFLVFAFFIAQIIIQINDLSATMERFWMSVLKYNSLALVYVYLGGGFLQIVSSIYIFLKGFNILNLVCKFNKNQIANQCENGNEIILKQFMDGEQIYATVNSPAYTKYKNQTMSEGIVTVNSIKSKLDEKSQNSQRSQDKISNPFIKQKQIQKKVYFKDIQDKQHTNTKQDQKYNENKSENNKENIQNKSKLQKSSNDHDNRSLQNKKVKNCKSMPKLITKLNLLQTQQFEDKNEDICDTTSIDSDIKKMTKSTGFQKKNDDQQHKKDAKMAQKFKKTRKLIKKLQLLPKITQLSQAPDTIKQIKTSAFQRQQNFT